MLSGWDKRVRKQTCCTLLSTTSLWAEKAGGVVSSRCLFRSEAGPDYVAVQTASSCDCKMKYNHSCITEASFPSF